MEVIYYVAASLDGFIASPEGGLDWLTQFDQCGEDHGYKAFYNSIDALVIGRKTFEQVLSFGEWPYGDRPTILASKEPISGCPPKVFATSGSPRDILDQLVSQGHQRVWLIGGAQLAHSFRQAGLIDEYLISVIPLILGGGIPLFQGTGPMEKLTLLESRSFRSGLTQLHYRRSPVSQ